MAVREAPSAAGRVTGVTARRWLLAGRVQGVGFRPFVHRLARAHGLAGWIRNLSGRVEIHAEGDAAALERFATALVGEAPALARPRIAAQTGAFPEHASSFAILPGRDDPDAEVTLPPDTATCADCLAEMRDPADRRYRYPFVNCTQCGPRYTLIDALPYARGATAMASFPLCPACRAEYEDPADRRFHAEPLACPTCGPRLRFRRAGQGEIDGNQPALAACALELRAGAIVAVKGVGGYHLVCSATDPRAVARLRVRKRRPDKPLAVMFADLAMLERSEALAADPLERAALLDPAHPIVLLRRSGRGALAPSIAPGLDEVGAMLAYSPLHRILADDHGAPLVVTSANTSGEPVVTDAADAETVLADVADAFLHHDRTILRSAEDPVRRRIDGAIRSLRIGRGDAPLEVALPVATGLPLLAVGGHGKNTVALGLGERAIVSPHIGSLDAPRGRRLFERTIEDLQRLHRVCPRVVVCDAHPDYASTRWARASGLPVRTVWHHHAHASALAGEHPGIARWLVFVWDGVGLGEDGTLWGAEALLGAPGRWRRVASLRPFRLPGGSRAAREPWRSAAALCWEVGLPWSGPDHAGMLRLAWERGVGTAVTSAAGRLFDAAASLLGLADTASHEAQGPMRVEAAAAAHAGDAEPVPLPLAPDAAGCWRSDWSGLVPMLADPATDVRERAARLHASLAQAIASQARHAADAHGFDAVGLTGGVFANRLLADQATAALRARGLDVRLARRVPCNDGGIAFGQIVEAAAALREG